MSVSSVVLIGAAVLVFTSTAFVILLRRLLDSRRAGDPGASPGEVSLARYRPMERLLGESDMRFLAAQPGLSRAAIRRLRRHRRAVFSTYLRELCRDFDRLFLAARILLITSSRDRPDLAAALFKMRLSFAFSVLMVRGRLLFHSFGLGTVDVAQLLDQFDFVREHVALWNTQPVAQRVRA